MVVSIAEDQCFELQRDLGLLAENRDVPNYREFLRVTLNRQDSFDSGSQTNASSALPMRRQILAAKSLVQDLRIPNKIYL